ncbi:MAG: hypothetical protein AAF581_15030 [Planctomycetota bacterium]
MTLFLAAVLCSCPNPVMAQESQQTGDQPASRPVADAPPAAKPPKTTATDTEKAAKPKPQKEIRLPHSDGTPIKYQWIVQGAEGGDTEVRWRVIEVEGESQIQITARSRFDALGRRLFYAGVTHVRAADLSPVSYERTTNVFSGGVQGGAKISATFADNLATVLTIQLAGGKQPQKRQRQMPTPHYLYGDQGFEHWVLLATRLAEIGSGERQFYMPSSDRFLPMLFTRIDPKDEEIPHPRGWTRWTAAGPALNATLWLDGNGLLRRYTQGEIAIVYVEPTQQKPSNKASPKPSPKRQPTTKPGAPK